MSYDRFDREEKDSHFYEYVDGKKKPCRACTSFKSVLHNYAKGNKKSLPDSENAGTDQNHKECPLDKDELGRRTWSFLHTMTAYYPDRPSSQQQQDMKDFIHLFSKFYPCDWCAKDFRKSIKQNEPDTKSQSKLSLWMCQQHNEVNRKLGKAEFDCSRYNERWRDGWKDGSCD